MNTDQARRLVALHSSVDAALANLRNANAMLTDDPRAEQLLEEAGDAYAEAHAALFTEQERVFNPLLKAPVTPSEPPSAPETPSEDSGKVVGGEEG